MIFYHFTKATIVPKTLSTRLEWQKVYNNFRILRSKNSNKRKNLQDTTNTSSTNNHIDEKQSNENTNKKIIIDKIGNYFNSPEALILFNCRDDEMVDDCLSQRIDIFDDILDKKKSVVYRKGERTVTKACT